MSGTEHHTWWKEAVVYQIYPASFQDTNGDGWGDISGVTSRLDILKDLGVDIVWLSPIFKSPQVDMGYDIADYKAIDPRYGTIEDVKTLIEELKKRDMKLMMDLVVNHTSDQHEWFLESKSSKSNPKRDWYIWKSPRFDDQGRRRPPNNWSQILGEANSAWTYDPTTEEYYLSNFTPEQPDLNWENPGVRAAVHDIMRFWLDMGACGFRMDVINMISKVQSFPDAKPVLGPGHEYHPGIEFFVNGPRMHEYLQEINREVLSKYDAITVGEMPGVHNIDEIIRTVGRTAGELNMIFIFDIVEIDSVPNTASLTLKSWSLSNIKKVVNKWQRAMLEKDGWNSVFIENHDQGRSISRYCDDSDAFRDKSAKMLALMQTTLSGTLYVYQGEEIGMRNVPIEWDPEVDYKDIQSVNMWKKYKTLYPDKLDEGRNLLQKKARDSSRLPMQFDLSPNAGFCKENVEPWMRVNDDYRTVNIKAQRENTDDTQLSVWQFWKRGLEARKKHKDVFVYGDFKMLDEGNEKVFAYVRIGETAESWLVVLNWCGDTTFWDVPYGVTIEDWMAGTYVSGKPEKSTAGTIKLEPWEGILAKCHI